MSIIGYKKVIVEKCGWFLGNKRLQPFCNPPESKWRPTKYGLVTLEITGAIVKASYENKLRTDEALVLEIRQTSFDPRSCTRKLWKKLYKTGFSDHDNDFKYVVGLVVSPSKAFDPDVTVTCASGIHFFLDPSAAMNYNF